jgi:hypothetical protein
MEVAGTYDVIVATAGADDGFARPTPDSATPREARA